MKADAYFALSPRAAIGLDDREFAPVESLTDELAGVHKANGSTHRNGSDDEPPEPVAFVARRLDELDAKPRPAIVQGLGFDEGAVGAIVGAPNAGKTAFAISVALAVASRAERWLGLKIAGGPVLYFGAEAPGSVIMRAKAAVQRMGLLARPPLYVSSSVPGLGGEQSAADTARVIATARAIESSEGAPVRLVCIDTLAACLADGDENGDGMLRLVAGAKHIALQTDAFVLLIHHPSKGDLGGMRGHGSLAAACDSVLQIAIEPLTGVRTATLVKARDTATGTQLRFELEQVILEARDSFGDPRSTIVVRATSQPAPRPRPSGQRQEQLLGELERRYRTGERIWDEATVSKAGRELGMHRNSPKSAMAGLVKSGYLTGMAAGYSLKHPPEDQV